MTVCLGAAPAHLTGGHPGPASGPPCSRPSARRCCSGARRASVSLSVCTPVSGTKHGQQVFHFLFVHLYREQSTVSKCFTFCLYTCIGNKAQSASVSLSVCTPVSGTKHSQQVFHFLFVHLYREQSTVSKCFTFCLYTCIGNKARSASVSLSVCTPVSGTKHSQQVFHFLFVHLYREQSTVSKCFTFCLYTCIGNKARSASVSLSVCTPVSGTKHSQQVFHFLFVHLYREQSTVSKCFTFCLYTCIRNKAQSASDNFYVHSLQMILNSRELIFLEII